MKLPRYELTAEDTLMIFEFISEGPNGRIPKLIKFSETSVEGVYNLAFGDKDLKTGTIDDLAVSNNGDSEQVLATVVSAVYSFSEKEKNAWIYATGSTKSRTRLYRMGITKYYNQIRNDFHIFGLKEGEWEEFEKEIEYSAFLAKRK